MSGKEEDLAKDLRDEERSWSSFHVVVGGVVAVTQHDLRLSAKHNLPSTLSECRHATYDWLPDSVSVG